MEDLESSFDEFNEFSVKLKIRFVFNHFEGIAMKICTILGVIFAMFYVQGCYSTDTKRAGSPMEVLNGDKYQPVSEGVRFGSIPLSGPFVKRKNSNTNVTGKIIERGANDYFKKPFKFKRVILERNGEQLTTSSNEFGEFKFASNIADGAWILKIPQCPDLSKTVDISGYDSATGDWEISCVK
ncbi:MAG: hypothetical protein NT027_09825 [Proteobacteria bacterium]|nr:hypothetical protein [Pseudomonadota bacterium]